MGLKIKPGNIFKGKPPVRVTGGSFTKNTPLENIDPSEIEKIVKECAESAIEDALKVFVGAISSEAGGVALRIINVVVPESISITIGPVSLAISDVRDKVDVIKHWVSHPPTGQDQILSCIGQLSPDSVSVNVGLTIPVIEQGISFSFKWTPEDFIQRISDIL